MAKKRTDPYGKPKPATEATPRAADRAAEILMARLARAKTLRAPFESAMQECYDYALVTKQGMFGQTPGQDRMIKVYDETAIVGTQEFASRIQSGLMPPFSRWSGLEAGSDVPKEEKEETTLALEEVTEYMFDIIQESNLNEEIVEALLDAAVGTGFLEIEEGDITQPIVAKAIPIPKMWIDVGPDDRIDTFFREHNLRLSQIRLKWPKAQIPACLIDAYEKAVEGAEDPVCRLIECVRRDYRQPNEERWLREVAHEGERSLILTEEFHGEGSCPIIGFRWSKMSGETWGRGPLQLAMPAIKTCNLTIELILENAEFAISGMYTAEDDGVVNVDTIQIVPGTVVPVAPGSGGLKAVGSAGNFDVAQLVLTTMQANIRKALYNESMGAPGKTPLSATEIAERQADLSRIIGSSFGRLMHELVQPLVRRIVYLLRRQKLIEIPSVNGRAIRVRSTSPLARAQEMQDVSTFNQFGNIVTAQFGPQMKNLIVDAQQAAPWLAAKMGVPKKLVRTEAGIKQIVAQMGQLNATPEQVEGNGPDPNQAPALAAPGP